MADDAVYLLYVTCSYAGPRLLRVDAEPYVMSQISGLYRVPTFDGEDLRFETETEALDCLLRRGAERISGPKLPEPKPKEPSPDEQARREALAAYKKAVRAARRSNWEKVHSLTDTWSGCAFCHIYLGSGRGCRGRRVARLGDSTCPARDICSWEPDRIARRVRDGELTAPEGIERLETTVAALEALEIGG